MIFKTEARFDAKILKKTQVKLNHFLSRGNAGKTQQSVGNAHFRHDPGQVGARLNHLRLPSAKSCNQLFFFSVGSYEKYKSQNIMQTIELMHFLKRVLKK